MTTFLINQTIISRHGEATFITAGSHTWLCPYGVTNVCIAVCGAGGAGGANSTVFKGAGGGGGGFAYVNNLRVYPGNNYSIQVGTPGGTSGVGGTGSSWFDSSSYLYATGGGAGAIAATNSSTNGGGGGAAGYSANGGFGGSSSTQTYAGGLGGYGGGNAPASIVYNTGGRGGYASSGASPITTALLGTPSDGGAAAGGAAGFNNPMNGGGVSYDGQSSFDANNIITQASGAVVLPPFNGIAVHNGGSNGTSGGIGTVGLTGGGSFGGGSAGGRSTAGNGFVRIIWGIGREYPNTVTGTI